MSAKLANLGYMALKKQTDKNVAVTPDVYVPLYTESLMTKVNLDMDNAIAGNKMAAFQSIQGVRDHMGDLQVLAEPTTAGYIIDMLLTKGTTTGGTDPYTHPFTLDPATDPKAYTVDIAKGDVVFRFIGVECYELGHEFSDNKMLFNLSVAARKSFIVREIESVSGTGDIEVTFKTNYDPSPTTGLVAGDIIRILLADGSTLDKVIDTVDSAIKVTLTVGTSGVNDGDLFYLRAATPSFSLVTPFLWSRTEFRFASSAATALTAAHTPLQSGTEWKLQHNLEENEGAKLSGSFDPADLVRTQGDAEFSIKARFETATDMNRFLTNQKRALVIRHFSGDDHELRVTLNNLRFIEDPVELKTGEIIYAEGTMKPIYDVSDGQGLDVTVLNSVASI
jgi:hypothetical protein